MAAAHVGTAIPDEASGSSYVDAAYAWITTVDHKRIGILYLVTSLGFFLLAGLGALLMRTQLAVPNARVLSPDVYNQVFTTHGTTMVFFVVMPAGIGFGNYFVPLMIGARDMAFARLNALSYWMFLFAGLLLYVSIFEGGLPNAGWFGYPPLSVYPYGSNPGMDYWALSLLVAGAGSIAGSLNTIVTIVTMRAPGMAYGRMPLFVWSMLVTSFLIIWGMPTFTAAAAMVVLDRIFGAAFFQPHLGGDPILYQHLFWWLGHPEVYIMFLPMTGIMSEAIPVFARKPIFGYPFVAGSTVFIGFTSMLVWAHHMFAVGMTNYEVAFFSGASLLVAIPTGVKIFNWLATLWGGAIRFTTAMLFAMGFIANFTIGGLTGVAIALVPFDWQVTDSYYIVAHLHYVLIGGSVNGLFLGTYYWYPKMFGRLLDERLGRWHFWTTMIGLTLAFMPMHVMGIFGMPRRVYTYPAGAGLTELNLISTVGAYILGLSTLIFLWNIWKTARHGEPAGDNPWDAPTLEWSVSSPPPPENFATVPTVTRRYPLWAEEPTDPAEQP
jgi:cytochrome c oxidase subunit I